MAPDRQVAVELKEGSSVLFSSNFSLREDAKFTLKWDRKGCEAEKEKTPHSLHPPRVVGDWG